MTGTVTILSNIWNEFSAFAGSAHRLDDVLDRAKDAIAEGLGVECLIRKATGTNPVRAGELPYASTVIAIDGDSARFGELLLSVREPRRLSREDVAFAESIADVITAWLRRAHYARDRARLSTVVAATNEAVVGVTPDGQIFSWNEAAEGFCGYRADEIVGRDVSSLFVSPHWSGHSPFDWQRRREPFEAILRHRDGQELVAAVHFAPVVMPDGHVAAFSMTAADVAEKRRADHAIRMHADILAHLPSGVMVWKLADVDDARSLTLLLANDAADRLAGCALSSHTGARFKEIPPVDLIGDDPEPYAAVVRANEPRDFGDRTIIQTDQSRRICRMEAFSLPERCLGVLLHDVTERRDLADQLQHAQRLEVVGRLTGGIAHDFNNLLTVITGYSDLLRPAMAGNPGALEELDQIVHASRSAQELTRQLLAFGRRQHLTPTTTTLGAIVEGTRRILERVIGEDIQLIVLNQNPVTVSVDVRQLEQVLLNLAINARDAMPAGGKLFIESTLVHVKATSREGVQSVPPGTYGVLQITDTGVGMTRAVLDRIFEPFFTTKEVGKGTGLGLSTAYGIVKQSGGHVTARSEPGEGATFTIYLPAVDVVEGDAPVVDPSPAVDRVDQQSGSQTVLLVDDDEAVAFLLQRLLRRAGYRVLAAKNAEEAVQLAERNPDTIDLLLTDVVLPIQSGRELAARLTLRFPGLRVLYMSGYTPDTQGHRALPQDAVLLGKPFTPGELLDSVQRVLAPSTGQINSDRRAAG